MYGFETCSLITYHRLGVVAQPVAKVDTLDHHAGPFMAFQEGYLLEHVFDVAMAPVVAFDLGDGGDVTSAEGVRRSD